jgi:hypothetical protein
MDTLYKYQAAGWEQSASWAVMLTCRENPLDAQDCDVLLVLSQLLSSY